MASCGDVATQEALTATVILRERLPELKVRFVNVVGLFKLQPLSEHPHGSTEREFDSLFTTDQPVIFNFHGYPWLIHKLAYRFNLVIDRVPGLAARAAQPQGRDEKRDHQ